MTKFTFDLTSALEEGRKRAEKQLTDHITVSAGSIASTLMNNGRFSGKEGVGHEILRKKIEDYVLSEEFDKKIDETIHRVADQQLEEAVKTLINHRARKIAFAKEASRQK